MSQSNNRIAITTRQEMEATLGTLPKRPRPQTEIEETWRSNVLHGLISEFSRVARDYFNIAEDVIGCMVKKHADESKAEYYFGKILRNINAHVELLSDLNQQLQASSAADQHVIEGLLGGIASRFSEYPVLIPVLASSFHYMHFNYVQGIGAVGFPAHVFARPAFDVPVLWHEVAGFWVAQERTNNSLAVRADKLRQMLREAPDGDDSGGEAVALNWYIEQYTKSVLSNIQVKLNVNADAIRVENSRKIRIYFKFRSPDVRTRKEPEIDVETDPTWQMAWLGEFMEDLFGIDDLDTIYFETLVKVLMRNYPTPELGNATHPSPILRLQVALERLKRRAQAGQAWVTPEGLAKVEKQVSEEYPQLVGKLSFHGDESSDKMVVLVASRIEHCAQFNQLEDEKGHFTYSLQQLELDNISLAKELLLIEPGKYTPGDSKYNGHPTVHLARQKYLGAIQNRPVRGSNYLWTKLGYDPKERRWTDDAGPCEEITPEQAESRLERLFNIKFTDTDATPGVGEPPPTIPPPRL